MHTYSQLSRLWTLPDGSTLEGYSGHGAGLNNPAMQNVRGEGPVPRGLYTIGALHTSPHTGPDTMNLEPDGHDALGRTLLRIHGDNSEHDHTASDGCIIIPGAINRQTIYDTDDHYVTVV
jgi:Protein of unknown function (DUF2778)